MSQEPRAVFHAIAARTPAVGLTLALLLAAAPWPASAFSLESVVTDGCHEKITVRALAQAGLPTPALAATREDQTLAANLPFQTPADADLWTLSMLVGVLDNDLHGYGPSDLPELAGIHNGEHTQDEHCLRSLTDDGAEGDTRALGSCREFIRAELALALADPDPLKLEAVAITLRFNRADVPLSAQAFHLGRALHALQDSFAHSFRTENARSVLSVLNYVGPALSPSYEPHRGGHPHLAAQDRCEGGDPKTKARVDAAIEASAALLTAVARTGARADRIEGSLKSVDGWLGYVPGCGDENDWCGNAPQPASGCAASGGGLSSLLALLFAGSALRRLRRPPRSALVGAALSISLLGPLARASADELRATAGLPAPRVETLTGEQPSPARFALHLATGVSIERGAGNLAVGAALKLSRRFTLGLDVEYSPWFDLLSGTAAAGTVNAYASLSFAWASFGAFEVRSAVEAGGSVLLFNAPGARAGSVGLLLGASPLRLEVQLSPRLQLELSPEIVIAAPSLRGVPLGYRQYRAVIGLRWSI